MKRTLILMLIVPFFWALNFVFGKMLTDVLPPFSIASGRFTVAGIIFLLWILIKKRKLPKTNFLFYLNLFAIGFTGVCAFNAILYIGLRHTTVVNATIINSFNPIATIILAVFILKEKVGSLQYAGAALSIIGVLFIMTSGHIHMITKLDYWDIIIFLNTFVWALFSILGKKAMEVLSPLDTIAFTTLMSLPFLWLASAIEIHAYHINVLPWSAVYMLIFLGVFASVLAFVWWYEGIKHYGASGAAIFYNLIPLYALIISRFCLGESIFPYQIIGGLLIIGGVFIPSLTLNKNDVAPSP